MNTSLSWIKAYVPELEVTAQEFTDAMTLSGSKVEGFTKMDADLEKIVIGQIKKIEKHPDADKLIICQVNIGTETIQIVTGAPNVKEGDKVSAGDKLLSFDPEKIKAHGYEKTCILVVTNGDDYPDMKLHTGMDAVQGETVIAEF